jgi:hypothetical protein
MKRDNIIYLRMLIVQNNYYLMSIFQLLFNLIHIIILHIYHYLDLNTCVEDVIPINNISIHRYISFDPKIIFDLQQST